MKKPTQTNSAEGHPKKGLAHWLKEPLVHFLLLGAALFALQALIGEPEEDSDRQVDVTSGQIERLRATWTRQYGRPPTDAKLQELIDAHVREEIYFREAVRLNLDVGDVIVRRRLAQKLEFIVRDLHVPPEPPQEELRSFFAKHAGRYAEPAKVSFTHIYFSEDRRPEAMLDAETALAELHSDASPPNRAPGLGDPFMLHIDYAERSQQEIAQDFGLGFAQALFELESGGWQGPLRSSYGAHLVRLHDQRPTRQVELAEVREAVTRDWQRERRQQANAETYSRLRELYDVSVAEIPHATGQHPLVTASLSTPERLDREIRKETP